MDFDQDAYNDERRRLRGRTATTIRRRLSSLDRDYLAGRLSDAGKARHRAANDALNATQSDRRRRRVDGR